MRSSLLNVREHLKTLQELIDLYKVYGACPLFDDGLAKLSLINRAILRKHEEGRKGGNRKDLRLTNNTSRGSREDNKDLVHRTPQGAKASGELSV